VTYTIGIVAILAAYRLAESAQHEENARDPAR